MHEATLDVKWYLYGSAKVVAWQYQNIHVTLVLSHSHPTCKCNVSFHVTRVQGKPADIIIIVIMWLDLMYDMPFLKEQGCSL